MRSTPPPPPPTASALVSAAQFGRCAREAREALGWTYAKAAAKCRVSYRFYWELENGAKPHARLDKVLAVARGLGLQILVLPGNPR
jgi:transcriptional regulator with XRE-family HTH domain